MNREDAHTMWGVAHAQGIRWCSNERAARQDMEDMVKSDARRQSDARGKVRLVRREVGPVEVIENPYDRT